MPLNQPINQPPTHRSFMVYSCLYTKARGTAEMHLWENRKSKTYPSEMRKVTRCQIEIHAVKKPNRTLSTITPSHSNRKLF